MGGTDGGLGDRAPRALFFSGVYVRVGGVPLRCGAGRGGAGRGRAPLTLTTGGGRSGGQARGPRPPPTLLPPPSHHPPRPLSQRPHARQKRAAADLYDAGMPEPLVAADTTEESPGAGVADGWGGGERVLWASAAGRGGGRAGRLSRGGEGGVGRCVPRHDSPGVSFCECWSAALPCLAVRVRVGGRTSGLGWSCILVACCARHNKNEEPRAPTDEMVTSKDKQEKNRHINRNG